MAVLTMPDGQKVEFPVLLDAAGAKFIDVSHHSFGFHSFWAAQKCPPCQAGRLLGTALRASRFLVAEMCADLGMPRCLPRPRPADPQAAAQVRAGRGRWQLLGGAGAVPRVGAPRPAGSVLHQGRPSGAPRILLAFWRAAPLPPGPAPHSCWGTRLSPLGPHPCCRPSPPAAPISLPPRSTGMCTFDPGFGSTASCESSITYIDGNKGVLLYRG